MGNKQQFKRAVALALAVPFMAFGLVLAGELEGTAPTKSAEEIERYKAELRLQKQQMLDQMTAAEKEALYNKDAQTKQQLLQTQTKTQATEAAKLETLEKTRALKLASLGSLMQAQIKRAENVLGRMGAIMGRLETRRDKMAEAGADLEDVNAQMAEAEGLLADAREALDQAKSDYAALENSDEPRVAVLTFMASMKNLKKQLIELHGAMKDTVKAMRQAMPAPENTEETEEAN